MTKKGFTLIEIIVSIIILSIVLIFSKTLFINFRRFYITNKNEQKINLFVDNVTDRIGRILREYSGRINNASVFVIDKDIRFLVTDKNNQNLIIDLRRGWAGPNVDDESHGIVNIYIFRENNVIGRYWYSLNINYGTIGYFKLEKTPLSDIHPLKAMGENYLNKIIIPIISEEGQRHDIVLYATSKA